RREVEVRRLVLLDEDHDADRSTLCRSGHGEELTEPTAARVAAAPPARGSAARSGPDDSQVDPHDTHDEEHDHEQHRREKDGDSGAGRHLSERTRTSSDTVVPRAIG